MSSPGRTIEIAVKIDLNRVELLDLMDEAESLHMQPGELLQQWILIGLAAINIQKNERDITATPVIVEPNGPAFQPPPETST